jgi:hypothetical protein
VIFLRRHVNQEKHNIDVVPSDILSRNGKNVTMQDQS